MSVRARASSVALAAALAGCAPAEMALGPTQSVGAPTKSVGAQTKMVGAQTKMVGAQTTAEWRAGLAKLEALRRAAGAARTMRISLALREPITGRRLTARGAVALAPPRALRMILLGPGGTTALDLWMSGPRYRFAVPAIDLEKRGDLTAPRAERRGLPVDFLGFWLLRPASGELLWYGHDHDGDRFVLKDDTAIVDLVVQGDGRVSARRTTFAGDKRLDEETVEAGALGCASVRYHQASTGLDVTVQCEGETIGDPPARALAEPGAEGGA
ncbi:Hypothetical protein A7982_06798 [Minicystis rosea]|nr:Hypothetical protein A7982_06798 [Minicystis rosea]